MHSTFYRGCWHVVSKCLFLRYPRKCSLRKMVYNPKAFIPHAVSLRQAFAHCAIFPVAATRRCRPRVSVTLWGATLSRPLPVVALVGHYPTNKLMGHRLLSRRIVTSFLPLKVGLMQDYLIFRQAILHQEADSYALLTRLPLSRINAGSLDLHT